MKIPGLEERLIEAYKARNVADLARKMDESHQTLDNWIKGRRKLPITKLFEIAASTKCSIHWLLTGEGPKFVVEGSEAEETSRIKLDANETIFIEWIEEVEGKEFDEIVRELVHEALLQRSSMLFTDYRKLTSETLETLLKN